MGGSDITKNDADISQPAASFQAKDGGTTKFFTKAGIVPREHCGEIGSGNWSEAEFSRLLGVSIPGADIEALVTTEETIPDKRSELFGNRTRMFDGEIGETTPCIEHVGLRKSICGAGIQTTGAGSTVVLAGG